jgi:hypothetical protein
MKNSIYVKMTAFLVLLTALHTGFANEIKNVVVVHKVVMKNELLNRC